MESSGSTSSANAELLAPGQYGPSVTRPLRPPAGPINRPTIPLDEYRAAKAAASNSPSDIGVTREAIGAGAPAPALVFDFAGSSEGENGVDNFPPDVDAAVGLSQILQPTNSSIDVWNKNGVRVSSISENAFVGNSSDSLGDARAIYDSLYNKWIVVMADFSNVSGSGSPLYYLAVSETSDAAGAYFVYSPNLDLPPGQGLDFPQLGIDQDALLITSNTFNDATNAFTGAIVFAIPKAQAYNGQQYNVPVFRVSPRYGTLAPPLVEDNNGKDFFVAIPNTTRSSLVKKFTMTEAGRSNVTFTGPLSIAVPIYQEPPPDANQTCTGSDAQLRVDTSDGRFQNRSFQYAQFLWQTHTVNQGARPVPIFYEFNTTTNTTVQRGFFSASATSFDFNPHIAADPSGNAIVTWTATDPTASEDALVMFGGRTSAALPGVMVPGPVIKGSETCLVHNFVQLFGDQRWGDYSAVNLDPAAAGTFWVSNERITGDAAHDTDFWATRHAKVIP